ncbi:MAG: divalent metal cation transporter [Bryobacteraceae bacterium]|nr:divalent metal cation transporter [Bryobacteraceae bacterium]
MKKLRRLLGQCGPGIISGAGNDDPSCIVSYSIVGAMFGYSTLWTSLFALPLIASLQMMSARLGLVSGRGLAGAARTAWSPLIVVPLCCLLAVANIVTLGADLGGMADVTSMITGLPSGVWTIVYAAGIVALLFYLPYGKIENIFKWLCMVLFAYVIAGVLARPDWTAVIANTLVPRVSWSREYLSTLVAIIGATVSPYFLFWQTSQEVENQVCLGRHSVAERRGATGEDLERVHVDVIAGSTISKLIAYFITITTAATLFANGKTDIATAQEAAASLEPFAGDAARLLFAAGVIGTVLLAIPVLAGSCAYAWPEAMRWRASLIDQPAQAPNFYIVIGLSVAVGLGLLAAGLHVVDMLFWASVMNGLLAPLCILAVLLLTGDPKLMGNRRNGLWLQTMGWIAFVVSGGCDAGELFGFTLVTETSGSLGSL